MDSNTVSTFLLAGMTGAVVGLFALLYAWEKWHWGWKLRWAVQGVRTWLALKIAPWLVAHSLTVEDFEDAEA